MTREERCELAIERGYTYDAETGFIYNRYMKILNNFNTAEYISIGLKFNKKRYGLYGHQFAWYWVNKECVEELDHINGIRNDNRICNLRSVTRQQNNWNRTKAKGYYWSKNNQKWRAQIYLNKGQIHLGLFKTEQEARNAYLQAKEKYHII